MTSYNDWVDTLEEVNTSPVAEKNNENVESKEDGEGFHTQSPRVRQTKMNYCRWTSLASIIYAIP